MGDDSSSDGSSRYVPVSAAAELLGMTSDRLQKLAQRGRHNRVRSEGDGRWLYEVFEGHENAGPRVREIAPEVSGVSYLYDSANKNPRYLIRNGRNGALVNQMASRVHHIAYAIGSASDVLLAMEESGIGAVPDIGKQTRKPFRSVPAMVHISTRDVHVGEPGDPKSYEDEVVERVSNTLEFAAITSGRLEQVVVTLGSDWLTVDNAWRTTTKGTQIPGTHDVYDIMRWSEQLAIRVIDIARTYADSVHCLCEQGNHDAVLGAAMARTCKAWFRQCDDVTVEIPRQGGIRTYHQWRTCMLASHHGHIKSPQQLPRLVAAEAPSMWGECPYRFLMLGHRHHSQRWAMGDLGGCEVIQTRSPSRMTDYEVRMGHIDDIQTLESFIFEEGVGMRMHYRA